MAKVVLSSRLGNFRVNSQRFIGMLISHIQFTPAWIELAKNAYALKCPLVFTSGLLDFDFMGCRLGITTIEDISFIDEFLADSLASDLKLHDPNRDKFIPVFLRFYCGQKTYLLLDRSSFVF